MGPVMCKECGAMLVKDVDERGITTIEGTYIVFQRKTDFVACPECLHSYPVRDLLVKREAPRE
ncbi:MAG: hypothetical protein ACYDCC_12795 [Actinomycetota bacterium]